MSLMKILKILITILISPLAIIFLFGITIYAIHEVIWNNKEGKSDIE